jgi:hypothetical protein
MRISKQEAVEGPSGCGSPHRWQSEGLAVRTPVLAADGREHYTLSAKEIDDALPG